MSVTPSMKSRTKSAGSEIPVVADNLDEVGVGLALLSSSVRVDIDGQRLCYTDCV